MTDTDSALDLDAWKASLTRWAKGLDLDDDDDRDIFRGRVRDYTRATRTTLLVAVGRVLAGETYVPMPREDLVRRIADAWISLSIVRARKPSRPGSSVGNPRIYAAVAAELRAYADELDIRAAQCAPAGSDRADTIDGDDR